MEDQLICPRRQENPGPFAYDQSDRWRTDRWSSHHEMAALKKLEYEATHPGSTAGMDDWRWPGDIPRTCSYCGGIHPKDAIRLVESGWEVEWTDKHYKVYLSPPGTLEYHRKCREILGDKTRSKDDGINDLPKFWMPTPPVKMYVMHLDEDQINCFNRVLKTRLNPDRPQT